MQKLFIEDLEIGGKKVLLRADFNVPVDEEGAIVDATRIEETLPSIRYVLQKGGALILMSHLGRPKYAPDALYSLAPIAKFLTKILQKPVVLAPNCVGPDVQDLVAKLKPGDVFLLENLRFHRAELFPDEDPDFAGELASYGDCYVNDAFATAHRKHSSTYTIAQHFPNRAAAGYLLEKEIRFLGGMLTTPERPFYAILGGVKISTKMGVIQALLAKVDRLLIGGAMSFTFLKAKGMDVGNSPIEESFLYEAKMLLDKEGKKILLPVYHIGATEISEHAKTGLFTSQIPKEYQGLDIGPQTIELFSQTIQNAKTLLWNGPLGVFEMEPFSMGTTAIAEAIANLKATTIVGGGDSVAALNALGLASRITHVSTGGGATLEFIEYGTLPGIEALSNKVAAHKK
jgi:phosphoglycerate kinase